MEALELAFEYREVLLKGLLITVVMAVVAIVVSTLHGLWIAMLRTLKVPVVSQLLRVYIDAIRGIPLLLIIFIAYFVLPYLNIADLTPWQAVLAAIVLRDGAYISEIMRASIAAVPRGHVEAARSLGLSTYKLNVKVVMPEAASLCLPPLVGMYVNVVKNTSLGLLIGFNELTNAGNQLAGMVNQPLVIYGIVAAGYMAICLPMSIQVKRMERKLNRNAVQAK